MEIDVDSPDYRTFFHYCEKYYYGRKVSINELIYTSYKVDGKEVESNPTLFLKLSHKYFTDIYNVPNPIKDSDSQFSFKQLMSDHWRIVHSDQFKGWRLKDIKYDKQFSEWYENAFNELVLNDNAEPLNSLIIQSKEIQENELKQFEKRLAGNTGTDGQAK